MTKFVRPGLLAAMLLGGSSVACADEVRLLAVNAIKGPVLEMVAAFEKSSGHKVVLAWGGTEAITKRVAAGESVDVVLIAAPNIDRLIADGRLTPGSRTDVARVGVGLAVRAGQPRPNVSTGEAVKEAVLAARSVGFSSGPSGYYLVELFKRWGIADQIKDKVTQPASGVQVGELVARGEVELGFHQVSELIHVKGIEFLGPLPAEIQNITVYSSGLHIAPQSPEAARALVRFLIAPAAGPILRRDGMEPG